MYAVSPCVCVFVSIFKFINRVQLTDLTCDQTGPENGLPEQMLIANPKYRCSALLADSDREPLENQRTEVNLTPSQQTDMIQTEHACL